MTALRFFFSSFFFLNDIFIIVSNWFSFVTSSFNVPAGGSKKWNVMWCSTEFQWAANLYETKLCNYELPLDSLVRCTLCKESPIPDTNGLIVVGPGWLQRAVWFPCRKGNSISHRIGLNSLQQEQWAKDGKECIFHEGIINLSQLLKLVGNYGMSLNGGLRGKALFVLGLF